MEKKLYPIMSADSQIQKYGMLPIETDPLGSYTGVGEEPDEVPVQDADDLS